MALRRLRKPPAKHKWLEMDGIIELQSQNGTRIQFAAMGFAIPKWENRLTGSALMTPASENCIRGIFMFAYLLVAIGGALGSVARFWLGGLIGARMRETFPWGTIIVNITGSFLIGLFFAITEPGSRWLASPNTRAFLMTGICGGYTTFSSFSLQTLNLLRNGEWLNATGNVVLSVVLCMVAVWLGYLLGTVFNSMKGS